MSNQLSRRELLERSMFATAAALAANSSGKLFAAEAKENTAKEKSGSSPNDQLRVACIGVNGRGKDHYGNIAGGKHNAVITMICDADEAVGQKACDEIAKKQGGNKPRFVQDMRQVFDNKEIDCITTATPNHWHSLCAIWAMQAGKDVYVEKPVSHNVSEGRRMVEVARKYNKICQTGTQSRSTKGMREAMAYIHDGKIGEVSIARGLCYKKRGTIGSKGTYEPPKSVNFDLWSGPAQLQAVTRPKFHYDWHWQWAYGNGDLGNQGIHQMDLCRWALQVDKLSNNVFTYGGRFGYEDAGDTPNTQVVIHDYGNKALVFEVRGLKTDDYKNANVGIIVEGANGYVVMTSYATGTAFDKDGKAIKEFSGGGDHYANFFAAVRNRKSDTLHGEILEGHLSSALCHTANISYRTGKQVGLSELREQLSAVKTSENATETLERTLKHLSDNKVTLGDANKFTVGGNLKFDPIKESFPGNDAANAMLTREYRAPFVVPTADKI